MMKRFAVVFLTLALSVMSAKTYSVRLFQPSSLAGAELQPGNYKVNLEDSKVTVTNGKQKVETEVKVENGSEKFGTTSVRYANENGKLRVQEIRLGGTNIKLVFN